MGLGPFTSRPRLARSSNVPASRVREAPSSGVGWWSQWGLRSLARLLGSLRSGQALKRMKAVSSSSPPNSDSQPCKWLSTKAVMEPRGGRASKQT